MVRATIRSSDFSIQDDVGPSARFAIRHGDLKLDENQNFINYSGENLDEENDNVFFNEQDTKVQINAGLNNITNKIGEENEDSISLTSESIDPTHLNFFQLYLKRYNSFITSPKVHFVNSAVFFITFLAIFSYMILCNFNFYKQNKTQKTVLTRFSELYQVNSSSLNDSNDTLSTENVSVQEIRDLKEIAAPNILEYLLLFWTFSLVFHEIRQVN
jgi:hypothetical protein